MVRGIVFYKHHFYYSNKHCISLLLLFLLLLLLLLLLQDGPNLYQLTFCTIEGKRNYFFFSASTSGTVLLSECCNGYTGRTVTENGNQMYFRFINNGDGDHVTFTVRYFGFDPG